MKIRILFTVVVMAVVGSAFKCGRNSLEDSVRRAAKFGGGVMTSTQVQQETPKGAHHYGKSRMSDAQLQAVDAGLSVRAELARADGLTNALQHSFYDIFTPTFDCQPSPEWRVMSFLVRGDFPWDGSEYDQYHFGQKKLTQPYRENGVLYIWPRDGIGVVFASEFIISVGTPESRPARGQMYVCPDMSVVSEAVANGLDHIALANNGDAYPDGYTYFWCSLYHGADSQGRDLSHSLLPRADRCVEPSLMVKPEMFRTPELQTASKRVLNDAEKAEARIWGIELTGDEYIADGVASRPVK
jgi:hypothetical protein